ncbi:hypothetical protein BRYFOR_05200 [Marvinbryantia formatexigens DSM 14469]|uniref:Uncharacterized protein n=1 Tax=Marvinbryantia formatexigens DSM 14469 TaxID=478749 RepID=C6L9B0_9FIRM|nr:hypothetical protein [Marvinbryantia formatexigens]EET62849.1 hypothetical protein BRYFOR_05200 [Marvinbryantia formatexigens DSM 14469]SDG03156.1 hypothetical protein SAMN05660368_01810 [Marvinbryantia formatexigens]
MIKNVIGSRGRIKLPLLCFVCGSHNGTDRGRQVTMSKGNSTAGSGLQNNPFADT